MVFDMSCAAFCRTYSIRYLESKTPALGWRQNTSLKLI
ncbi:hypothetical protein PPAR_a3751 [Pseudoalteromonas paragorgicola KMM 3548]|nr:hypothetical protein [Pseudoalteromonas distincta KMM 3548]